MSNQPTSVTAGAPSQCATCGQWLTPGTVCGACMKTITIGAPSGSAVARYGMIGGASCPLRVVEGSPAPTGPGVWVRAEDHDQVVQAKDAEIARLTALLNLHFGLDAMSAALDKAQGADDLQRRAEAADAARLQAETKLEHWKKLGDSVRKEDEQLQALADELGIPKPEDRQGYVGNHTPFSVIRHLQAARLQAEQRLEGLRQDSAFMEGISRFLRREQIGVSTGIDEETTYGYGNLDGNGFWEFPVPTALVELRREGEHNYKQLCEVARIIGVRPGQTSVERANELLARLDAKE